MSTEQKDSSQTNPHNNNAQADSQEKSVEEYEHLISELKKEITRLQKLNAKKEVEYFSLLAKAEARFKEALEEAKSQNPSLRILLSDGTDVSKKS